MTNWPSSNEILDPDLYVALIGDRPLAPDDAGLLFEPIKSFRAVDKNL